jgi:hypothetical protein
MIAICRLSCENRKTIHLTYEKRFKGLNRDFTILMTDIDGDDSSNKVEKFHLVEFRTLKDLFSFVITKSMPGQQFLSLIRFRDYTYTFTPIDHSVMIFFTRDMPKAPIYTWDAERDEFMGAQRADRSRVNLLVQEVVNDTMITSIFYNDDKKKA